MTVYKRLIILLAGLLFVLNISVAYAYNVYNYTNIILYVRDVDLCGDICPSCYAGFLSPGEYGSCPGNDSGCGSNDNIIFNPGDMVVSPTNPRTDIKCWVGATVPPHGWIDISGTFDYYDCSKMSCAVYDANGNVLYSGPCQNDLCG